VRSQYDILQCEIEVAPTVGQDSAEDEDSTREMQLEGMHMSI